MIPYTDKKSLPDRMNRHIGRAMHEYSMLDDGDQVLVALSGGVDSLVLTWVLHHWQTKAPIEFTLRVVHIDNDYWLDLEDDIRPTRRIRELCDHMQIPLMVERGRYIKDEERTCFWCAKQRRNQLFEMAEKEGYNKIAFGHHKDDLIETLFLNLLYSGNISTMLPRQELFGGTLSLIRPLAYVEKKEVWDVAAALDVQPVENPCPLAGDTRREAVRDILDSIYSQEPGAKSSIFAAMSNIRHGYLLE